MLYNASRFEERRHQTKISPEIHKCTYSPKNTKQTARQSSRDSDSRHPPGPVDSARVETKKIRETREEMKNPVHTKLDTSNVAERKKAESEGSFSMCQTRAISVLLWIDLRAEEKGPSDSYEGDRNNPQEEESRETKKDRKRKKEKEPSARIQCHNPVLFPSMRPSVSAHRQGEGSGRRVCMQRHSERDPDTERQEKEMCSVSTRASRAGVSTANST